MATQITHKAIVRNWLFLLLFLVLNGAAVSLSAQDTRNVTEPIFPATCIVVQAPLRSTADGPNVGGTAEEQDAESSAETTVIQEALDHCAPYKAVELALGSDRFYSAFLVNPLSLPENVSLILDGGVTVYGSRDPVNYQDVTTPTAYCGTIGPYAVNEGCLPLFSLASGSGIYGYGVIDGQGNKLLLGGENANKATWWDLTTAKKAKGEAPGTCLQPGDDTTSSGDAAASDATTDCQQASPLVFSTGKADSGNQDITLYKFTIRNPPFHTSVVKGTNLTVWGVKVQSPWNVPNTDGFDVNGSNITIYDATVANGDQEIAVTANSPGTKDMTVDQFHGYSKGGIALLVEGTSISNLLVQNVNITGDLPSVVGTTVNGMSEADMKSNYGLQSYGQALPNATNDLKGLQINTNINDKTAANVSNITFKSVCLQDVVKPIHFGPVNPFTSTDNLPTVQGVTLQDVHILAPTSQFPALSHGIPAQPAAPGSYDLTFQGYPQPNPPEVINQLTLDNLVIDKYATGGTSISSITAIGNQITTATNIYPFVFNRLAAPYRANPTATNGTPSLTLSKNSYQSTTTVSSPELANACTPADQLPFTTGELYLSLGSRPASGSATNLQTASVPAGSSITLHAVVQPIMSQTTYFVKDSYGANPGLLSVGSPALINPVLFYEGSHLLGLGRLSANGTLASFVVRKVSSGPHTYTAQYPKDNYYDALNFGSVTVEAESSPAN
jgi:polygalacturonase